MNQAHYHGGHPTAGRHWDKGQVIKWTVYGLLLLNFFYYLHEEWYIASHTLARGGGILDWMREFATVIDELGWFGLLFAFEMETYALSDEMLEKRRVRWTLHGVRLACYLMLAHTVLARVTTVDDYLAVEQAPGITDICQVADRGISYDYNYRYTEVTAENCADISTDTRFWFTEPTVITDTAGLEHYRNLVWVDLNDAVMWILVVWAIELAVWLQNRDITGGPLMLASHSAKLFYGFLWAHAIWWAWIGHWVWAWDETLWIAGFWAIENNLSEWREEIREEEEEEQEA